MNWLDIVIIIYLIISIISGIGQGLIRSVLSLVGLIVGIVLASHYYVQFGNVLGFIPNKDAANIVAFVIIVGVVAAVAAILGTIFKNLIHAIHLGLIDRLGGAVFGLVLGAFSIAALLTIILKYTNSDIILNSSLASFLLSKFPIALGLFPSEFKTIKGFFQ
jgi:membrane protein required for colicin V production